MGSFFGDIFSWILSRLLGKTPPPSQEVVQGREAASAETKLAIVVTGQAKQAAIAQAVVDAPKDTAGVVSELRKGTF